MFPEKDLGSCGLAGKGGSRGGKTAKKMDHRSTKTTLLLMVSVFQSCDEIVLKTEVLAEPLPCMKTCAIASFLAA